MQTGFCNEIVSPESGINIETDFESCSFSFYVDDSRIRGNKTHISVPNLGFSRCTQREYVYYTDNRKSKSQSNNYSRA